METSCTPSLNMNISDLLIFGLSNGHRHVNSIAYNYNCLGSVLVH